MKKVYLAGPLFTREEQMIRRHDVAYLRDHCPNLTFFSPLEVELSVDDPSITNAESTHDFYFNSDIKAINEADFLIVDLANDDNGTLLELGIAYGLNKPYIIINSDFRLCETGGMHRNSFVRGVEKQALLVTDSIEKVVEYLVANGELNDPEVTTEELKALHLIDEPIEEIAEDIEVLEPDITIDYNQSAENTSEDLYQAPADL